MSEKGLTETRAMLAVKGLEAWYGESHILHGVTFDVQAGEVVTLLGRNGVGKTTTLKAIMGIVENRTGSVRFEVVLPPTAPVMPVWPKRTILLAGIWIAALAVGAGIAYGLHVLKPIVSSVRAMNELTSYPVLGVVGVAFPTRQRAQFRRHLWRISAAAACWVAAFAVVLALNWSGARLTIPAIQSLVKT